MGTPNQGPAAHLAPPNPTETTELYAGHDQSWIADILSKGNTLVYIGLDDKLWLRAFSATFNCTIIMRGRVLRADGQVTAFEFRQPFTAAAGYQEFTYSLVQGFLLDLVVFRDVPGIERGQVFVQVGLARGGIVNDQGVAVLVSDYLAGGAYLSWPFGNIEPSCQGQGALISQAQGNPAAGSDFIYTVPASVRQHVIAVYFTFVTSAAVATREVSIIIDDSANILGKFNASASQAASLTNVYTGSNAPYAPATNPTVVGIPLPPDLRLLANYRLRSSTAAIDAADQFSTIRLLIEQWSDQ